MRFDLLVFVCYSLTLILTSQIGVGKEAEKTIHTMLIVYITKWNKAQSRSTRMYAEVQCERCLNDRPCNTFRINPHCKMSIIITTKSTKKSTDVTNIQYTRWQWWHNSLTLLPNGTKNQYFQMSEKKQNQTKRHACRPMHKWT